MSEDTEMGIEEETQWEIRKPLTKKKVLLLLFCSMLNGSHSNPRCTLAVAAESDIFFILTEDGLSRAFYHPYGGFF